MKFIYKIRRTGLALMAACLLFTACNKAPMPAEAIPLPAQGATPTLATLLDDAEFSMLKAAITRAGLLPTLSMPSLRFTLFAPNNDAFIASGIPNVDVVNSLPASTLFSLLSYHIIPQQINSTSIPTTFPNFEYPTILNPTGVATTPGYNPLVRLTTYPSKRSNGAWVNNIPITELDIPVVNGVAHKVAALVSPPSSYLWDVINASTDLTFFKAAIIRADSGQASTSTLQYALSNFGTNLTLVAPNDAAMQGFLIGSFTLQLTPLINAQLIGAGLSPTDAAAQAPVLAQQQATALASSPAVFTNPALYSSLTAETVRGLVVYHFLGTTIPGIRVFSVNLPTTPTQVLTLLNQAIPPHPGVTVQATFAGPFVATATIKGAANASPSNIVAKDINAVNGVLHKIDQVLLPQ